MAILSKGTDFSTGDQVTAANLDALVDSATFAAGAVDNSTTALDSSSPQKIIVKNGGIGTNQLATSSSTTTGVTFEKMQHVAANTVLVNDTNAEGDISAKAVADTQILIGDGTGFTAAALSGDVTMTNAGAVTIAADAVEGSMILSSTTLQNGVKCADQSASDNSTKIANTKYVDAQCNLIPNPAIVITTDARNGESQRYYKNLTEITDPNSIITINSGSEIQFASTGTYLVKVGATLQDNDTTSSDQYNIGLVANSSSTTLITYGGKRLEAAPSTSPDGDPGVVAAFMFAYAVTDTSSDKLAIYAKPISGASNTGWAGAAAIEITKII
tara:strand:+ start:242 stop:1228 length:987 start_codon:yes stop_codon:yes gene_type:complete